ncbi:DNA-binding death effector domain-containing protein 2 isoform X2 [Desmodus rotundus]|uniref:DNA-binding death effector domain-containing protein 2 isoform X2 n=1 Tax=Desmodus rotundus TaxID=9430 RepID=UPI001E1BEFA0|nr:DNA-binding death effector domain-containing protein 2 isoform X2 [Desmodus rotundus]
MALSGSTPAPSWEEDECLDYYGMLSLHRMFEVVGGQLTERELDLLAFLLDEAPGAAGGLSNARSGLELLLELERRGQCDESNLRLLGQLLRVLARHDLLPHLARKRRRPVSPERYNYGTSSSSTKRTEGSCRRRRQSSSSSDVQQDQWETGSPPTKRQRRSRGRPSGGARRRRRGGPSAPRQQQEQARPTSEGKVTCGSAPVGSRVAVPSQQQLSPPGPGISGSGCEQSTANMGQPWSRVWHLGGPRHWHGSWTCLGRPRQCCAPETWAPWCVTSSSRSSPIWTPSGGTT